MGRSLLSISKSLGTLGFLGGTDVKNPPAMQETWVRSLGWEDPLEEGMATHSSILAWRIPWIEEPGGLQSTESQRVKHNRDDGVHTHPNVWQYTGNQKNIIF